MNRTTFVETLRKVTQQVSVEAEKRDRESRTKVHMEEIIVLDGDITIPISEWKLRMETDAAETSD